MPISPTIKPIKVDSLDTPIREKNNDDSATSVSYTHLRRTVQNNVILSCGELSLDTKSRTAMARGEKLPLTRKELGLLEYLLLHQERPVPQEELIQHVWDSSVDSFSNSIRVHISALRKKLRAALGYDPIANRIGQGYVIGGQQDE